MRIVLLLISLTFLGLGEVAAQTLPVSEAEVRAELEKRGIAEEDLMNELAARGIDIEDFENLTPAQLAEIELIVQELEEKATKLEVAPVIDPAKKEEFLDVPTTQETEKAIEEIKEVFDENVGGAAPEPKIYGHAFFRNRDLSVFETSTEVKAPDNYILGAGDRIVISIYGISREELAQEINNEGFIEVNNRRIFLKGLTLGDAKTKLFQTLSRFYRFSSGEFDVSLSYSRTINVNIQGEVLNPGGYTLSAINNAFNGLIAAGGPSDIGSLRDILLVRKSGEIVNLDFYSFLQSPQKITNASLEEGDVIIVPIAREVVNIQGGVKRPMRYEMKPAESLADLLQLAGGFASDANRNLIKISRAANDGRIIIDVSANEVSSFNLQDGDLIEVRRVENSLNNFVELQGSVVNPGEYERTSNLTIAELLEVGQLLPQARRDLAFIRRVESDGRVVYVRVDINEGSEDLQIGLQNRDVVTIFSEEIYNDNQTFQVSGAVRQPGSFRIAVDQAIPIKDAIELAGGLRRDASGIGIIHTKDPLNPKIKQYMRIDLTDIYENSEFFTLGALDSLEIFSQSLFDERSEVSVSGAVNRPGTYQYGLGMSLADVLTMSGGFKIGAATNRVEIARVVIEDNEPTRTVIANLVIDRDLTDQSENLDFELQPYDEVMVRYVPEFELQQIVEVSGEVKFPGEYSLIKQNESVSDVLKRAGGITDEAFPLGAKLVRSEDNTGVIILKLDEILSSSNSPFDFKLQDGDQILIPKSRDFVTIIGATNANELYTDDILGDQNTLNVPFHKGKDAKFYIENYAGGFADSGSPNEVFVENANGQIRKVKNYFIYRNFPSVKSGSTIVVGRKPEKTESQREREDVDWSKVLADSVGQAVSILSLLLIIQRL